MEQYLGFVDTVMYEFKGQLGYSDIMGMTLKEIGYLRKHRNAMREAASKASGGNMTQAISDITSL